MELADVAYRSAYVLLVGMACAYARRWTWPLAAGGALLGGPTLPWAVVGGVALATAFASQFDRRRRQPVGAIVGTLAALVLLRLPPTIAFGVPSLLALLAPLPAIGSALAALRSSTRRPIVVAVGVAGSVIVAVVVVFGIGLLLVRGDARTGVNRARAGLEHLRAGDEPAATANFADAASAFDRANDVAGSWWMAPARAVPVLSQHLHATRVVTAEGRRLAEVSAATAPAVSLDDLTTTDGRFRIDRISEIAPLARRVVAALATSDAELAELSTDWLTGPMAAAVDELRGEVATSLPDARTAMSALELAPQLLGAGGARSYVVLLANPAEAREMGGFVGNVGLLTADDGRLDFRSLEDPAVLESVLANVDPDLDVDIPTSYANAQPDRFVRNWTDSPDIHTVAQVVADLFPDMTGGTADGVVYLDPFVIAALLELTGPITVPGTTVALTADNAADHLLRGQYLSPEFQPGGARKERLGAAGEMAFDRLTSGPLPGPRRMAELLSPLVRARRLLFTTTDPAPHRLLERVGLRPPMDAGPGETLLVTHGNRRANKLDAYLERAITFDAEISADGSVEATVRIELTNTAPLQGLADYQLTNPRVDDPTPATSNVLSLSVYTSLDATSVLVDGIPSASDRSEAYGLNRYAIPATVPAQRSVVIEIGLTGTVDPSTCSFSTLPNAGSWSDTFSSGIVTPKQTIIHDRRALDERITQPCAP